jgi:hypothetical protein
MQLEPPEKVFGLNTDNVSSISSCFDDVEISDICLNDNYSTISIINKSAVPHNDVDDLHPAGIKAGG